jgi:hypothetical protein
MLHFKTWLKKIPRRNWLMGLVGAVLLIGLLIELKDHFREINPVQPVPEDTVANVFNQLTGDIEAPSAGDTSVDFTRKKESRKNDSLKIAQDLQIDKNVQTPCDALLAEYRKIVDELVASNYSSAAMAKYSEFGMIKDENGYMRPGPKLSACKQDSLFQKAFDEIDEKMMNSN